MTDPVRVALESTQKKTFATAIDWPGWSRSGKTEELALESLAEHAPRYAAVARVAGEPFAAGVAAVPVTGHGFEVVERIEGDAGTAFGVPSLVTESDRRPLAAAEAERLASLVAAAWTILDRVAAEAPAELRKGPRGGGRDRDRIADHVLGAEHAYSRQIGLRVPAPSVGDQASIETMRLAILATLRVPSDGSPLAGRRWTARYAAGRIAWHVLDHAWEIEDRTDPA